MCRSNLCYKFKVYLQNFYLLGREESRERDREREREINTNERERERDQKKE